MVILLADFLGLGPSDFSMTSEWASHSFFIKQNQAVNLFLQMCYEHHSSIWLRLVTACSVEVRAYPSHNVTAPVESEYTKQYGGNTQMQLQPGSKGRANERSANVCSIVISSSMSILSALVHFTCIFDLLPFYFKV